MRYLILAASFFFILCWLPAAWCQPGDEKTVPIQIEADRMESSRENGAVMFFGNVNARQDELTIQADQMTVLYARTEASNLPPEATADLNRKVSKITAKGNVKIVQGEWIAAGDTMDFNAEERIVILTGSATAWQKQNMVSGERIVLYLDEGKSIVESSPQDGERVKAFIYPSSQENKDSENQ